MSLQVFDYPVSLRAAARGGLWLIGNFDGVHKGHQAIIRAMKDKDAHLGVVTFEPHPRRYFFPDQPFLLLTDRAEKLRRLEACGVTRVLVCRFDAWLAKLSAEDFIHDVLTGACSAEQVAVGPDFRFGAGRAGDVGLLQRWFDGQSVHILPPVCDEGGQPYSSSRVRAALTAGDKALAADLLGWPVP